MQRIAILDEQPILSRASILLLTDQPLHRDLSLVASTAIGCTP
jgi:hypothetical protein